MPALRDGDRHSLTDIQVFLQIAQSFGIVAFAHKKGRHRNSNTCPWDQQIGALLRDSMGTLPEGKRFILLSIGSQITRWATSLSIVPRR